MYQKFLVIVAWRQSYGGVIVFSEILKYRHKV